MQLNITTDYGIRVVLYLAQKNGLASSTEICENMAIPCGYMHKIARILKNAGIIREVRGVNGGFKLIKSIDDISILSIVRAFEKTVNINRCLEDDEFCSRNAAHQCVVRELYAGVQSKLHEMLDVKISTFFNL
ncbi:MAG: Rrf2 family transcriptional regulator [Nitrososphaerota archaeon]|nr:Rrf2 family transcriptional regulator [Nitrososphaerota archaeon]